MSDFFIAIKDEKARVISVNFHQLLLQTGKVMSNTIEIMQKAFGYDCMGKTQIK